MAERAEKAIWAGIRSRRINTADAVLEALAAAGLAVVPVPTAVECSSPPEIVLTYGTEVEAVHAARELAIVIVNQLPEPSRSGSGEGEG